MSTASGERTNGALRPSSTFPPLPGSEKGFIYVAAFGFALLYTETGLFSAVTSGVAVGPQTPWLLALSFVVVAVGFGGSFALLARRGSFPEGDFQDATPVLHYLIDQLALGVALVTTSSTAALLIYVYVVWPNLISVYHLIKDLFIYLATAIIYFQGLVAFVRYLQYLYVVKMHSAVKVIAVEVSLVLVTLVMGLYLVTADALSLARTPDPTGIVGLHITVRAIWLAVLVIVALGWHLKWVADH
jgi:hypothetical protein